MFICHRERTDTEMTRWKPIIGRASPNWYIPPVPAYQNSAGGGRGTEEERRSEIISRKEKGGSGESIPERDGRRAVDGVGKWERINSSGIGEEEKRAAGREVEVASPNAIFLLLMCRIGSDREMGPVHVPVRARTGIYLIISLIA